MTFGKHPVPQTKAMKPPGSPKSSSGTERGRQPISKARSPERPIATNQGAGNTRPPFMVTNKAGSQTRRPVAPATKQGQDESVVTARVMLPRKPAIPKMDHHLVKKKEPEKSVDDPIGEAIQERNDYGCMLSVVKHRN